MKNGKLKAILYIIGGIITTIIGILIGRVGSNRRTVRSIDEGVDSIGHNLESASDSVESIKDGADRVAGITSDNVERVDDAISDNRKVKSHISRAKDILKRATHRSVRDKPDSRLM